METIKLEKWESSPKNSRQMEYKGQYTAQEVFEELKHRLDSMGYLPDEYFLLDRAWEDGREIPRNADIFCTTDYGGSEGIYLDVYLKWYEDGAPITKSFITGKTLGESGADLDRMFLISSAITKAFHGDGGTYARYRKLGEQPEPEDMILHLNPSEQRLFINALVEQRERLVEQTSGVEQLLRRMTGSITAYMDEVGQRPLRLSAYDRAVLAIHDGEYEAFSKILPETLAQADGLLIETAGRPGPVGCKMCALLLIHNPLISYDAYLTACKRAVDTGDAARVKLLVEQADRRITSPRPSFHGEVIRYAYGSDRRSIAKDLIQQCTPEQIAAAPSELLVMTAMKQDFQTALALVDKGAQPGHHASEVLRVLTANHQERMAEQLLKEGMPVAADDYAALSACVQHDAVEAAKLLLDRGMDFEQYRLWAEGHGRDRGHEETLQALAEHWAESLDSPHQDGPVMGGMAL